MRKPRLTPKAMPADHYAGPGERIAEFSFPEAADANTLPGGLIRFQYRDGKPPLVVVYAVEGCEVKVANGDA